MKKIHLIVQGKDVESSLERLRLLQIVHVEHLEAPKGNKIQTLKEEIGQLQTIVDTLAEYAKEIKCACEQKACPDTKEQAKDILEKLQRMQQLQDNLSKIDADIKKWSVWGNFNPEDIKALTERGIYVQLLKVPAKDVEALSKEHIVQAVAKDKSVSYCVVVLRENIALPFDRVYPPEASLSEMQDERAQEHKKYLHLKEDICDKICHADAFMKMLIQAKDQLAFEEASSGMAVDENLHLLKGFCPVDKCGTLEETARKEGWGILIEEPADEDVVPTELRNPKWVEVIKPVFNLIEILPGYKEFDVSVVFLLFFTAFFGILIGDAAYGLIFLGLTVFAQIKMGKSVKDKTPFILMYLLTFVTIVWGVLTGVYFGQQWLALTPVKPILPWLNDEINIQLVCFVIALAHLSVARVWGFFAQIRSVTCLAQIGWLLIVWGMFFTANYFVLGFAFPSFAKWFFFIGVPLAFFFMVPPNKFLKTVPMELIPFVLTVIGAGTDIVSYIRLFAVGLATVAVADAANALPQNFGPIGGAIGLIFLHALNMVLAVMAILVHAVRLNVLEFSGHLGLQWSGFKYNPFTKTVTQG